MWKTFLIGKPECHRLNVRVNFSDSLLVCRSLNRTLSYLAIYHVVISAKSRTAVGKQAKSLKVLVHGYGDIGPPTPYKEELQNFKFYIANLTATSLVLNFHINRQYS